MKAFVSALVLLVCFGSCRNARIHEEADWAEFYNVKGIEDAAFIIRDHSHETIHYLNKDESSKPTLPASTFKIFNSLVALETGVAPDDNLLIKWDGVQRSRAEWNQDLTLRNAFKYSAVWYFKELARRVGQPEMQRYLDTVKYGNHLISKIDTFWLDGSLKISPDEQVGFLKQLYFSELPFAERTQRIVKSMMLQEDSANHKLYYKTGWGEPTGGKDILWVVGFSERIQHVKEMKGSMNNSDIRAYPYFFAQRFSIAHGDTSQDWGAMRIVLLKKMLKKAGAI